MRSLYFPLSFSLDKRVPFRGRVRQEFSAVSLCRSLEGGNLIIGQAPKPKKAHGKTAAVDLEPDIVKKGDGLARLTRACFTFKMALKFKPVVVTAVLICDPLFSD